MEEEDTLVDTLVEDTSLEVLSGSGRSSSGRAGSRAMRRWCARWRRKNTDGYADGSANGRPAPGGRRGIAPSPPDEVPPLAAGPAGKPGQAGAVEFKG